MEKNPKILLRRLIAMILALFNLAPSITVILNPLLFIMFFPLGIYAFLSWPWIILKDIPDPFHPGESLYWLTYTIHAENSILLPSLFRWGIIDLSLTISGLIIFLAAFTTWLANLRKDENLLTCGVYGVSRHPQYLGIILLTLGLSIRSSRPISLIAWATLLFSYLFLASLEEKSLLETYGEKYEKYMKKVAFMIPFLKARLPEYLSPKKPYRYALLIMLNLIATFLIISCMRDVVCALR